MMASGGVHEFPHRLIEEVEKDHHFNCTVEVSRTGAFLNKHTCISLLYLCLGRSHLSQGGVFLLVRDGLHNTSGPRTCLDYYRFSCTP